MTRKEAADSIGEKFKIADPAFSRWTDTIMHIDSDGQVHGVFLTAHHDDCRFVFEQPQQLKKKKNV